MRLLDFERRRGGIFRILNALTALNLGNGWYNGISVVDGEIVLDAKPMGTLLIVR